MSAPRPGAKLICFGAWVNHIVCHMIFFVGRSFCLQSRCPACDDVREPLVSVIKPSDTSEHRTTLYCVLMWSLKTVYLYRGFIISHHLLSESQCHCIRFSRKTDGVVNDNTFVVLKRRASTFSPVPAQIIYVFFNSMRFMLQRK